MGKKQTQLAMQQFLSCNRLYKNVARDTWPFITGRDADMSEYVESFWGTRQ